MQLGEIGIWTNRLDRRPASEAREAVRELDELGFAALWLSESPGQREAVANAALMLSATERIVVATGVASIWARDAVAMVSAQRTLAEAWPRRFILGMGVSHDRLVEARGHTYRKPLEAMRHYLDQMDGVPAGDTPHPPEPPPRVLAALGPRMLELARDRAQGAHPFLVTPEHTAMARGILGLGRLLCPEQPVIFAVDETDPLALAAEYLAFRLTLPNYRHSLERMGFGEEDFGGGGTERLLRRLFVIGDLDDVAARVRQHRDAGADHVALQVVTTADGLPREPWRRLAGLIS
jgi:probable F420-dependent oxidoreductase